MPRPLGILVLAYGGPEREEDVAPFLRRVMAPREPSEAALQRAMSRYLAIGGRSPLVLNTAEQAEALADLLNGLFYGSLVEAAGGEVRPIVAVGFKHWVPSVTDALERLAEAGCGEVHALILSSHQSERATGAYLEAAREAASAAGVALHSAPSFHLSPGYIRALTDRIREALEDQQDDRQALERCALLFTAHSLPLVGGRSDEVYLRRLDETARSVAKQLQWPDWRLAFQSRSPRPGVQWMGPAMEEVVEELAVDHDAVLVVPLGFVSEHLETLYDLDIEAARMVHERGLRFLRAGAVGTHPDFVEALAGSVLSSVAAAQREGAIKS